MKVLVLDDEPDMGMIIGHMVRKSGHEVRVHDEANEAFESAHEFRPAVVICDRNMPQTTGMDFYLRLKEHGWKGAFVILTGDITSDVDEITNLGIKHVLFKPQDLSRIIPLLNELQLANT